MPMRLRLERVSDVHPEYEMMSVGSLRLWHVARGTRLCVLIPEREREAWRPFLTGFEFIEASVIVQVNWKSSLQPHPSSVSDGPRQILWCSKKRLPGGERYQQYMELLRENLQYHRIRIRREQARRAS